MSAEILPSHVLVRQAADHLIEPCPAACRAHDVTRATGRLLLAMWIRADAAMDSSPEALRTRPYVESFLSGSIPGWREALLTAATVLGRDLLPEWRVGQQVRSMHPASFMREEWGTIISAEDIEDRLHWGIRWPDGATDVWRCADPVNVLQFREAWEDPDWAAPVTPEPVDPTRIVIPPVGEA